MNTSDQIKNTLSFITDILNQDVLPYFDQAVHQYSVTDMSAILSKFLILQQSIVNLEGTFDQKIALIESPIIREIDVLENCQTVIIPDLDILAHGGCYEIEFVGSSNGSIASQLKFLLNDDVTETNYRSQVSTKTTAFSGVNYSYASIGYLYSMQSGYFVSNFFLNNDGSFYFNSSGGSYGGVAVMNRNSIGIRTNPILNITSLTIYSDVANGISVGSKIIIRRKDV